MLFLHMIVIAVYDILQYMCNNIELNISLVNEA